MEKDQKLLLKMQVDEITSCVFYRRLATIVKDPHNRTIIQGIADDEVRHYHLLRRYTGQSPRHSRVVVAWYLLMARLLGLTFAIRLMERGEVVAQNDYRKIYGNEDFELIAADEVRHETELVGMINEQKLHYMGSVVLGLNDALVELTGALAGFTLALQNPGLIALTGTITGIAAALSMASSEYLSTKSEGDSGRSAGLAAFYTGIAYLFTVVILILPFLLLHNVFLSLGATLVMAMLIIAAFNYYYSVARNENFWHRFREMALLSFGVASFSFFIGFLLKKFSGIDV